MPSNIGLLYTISCSNHFNSSNNKISVIIDAHNDLVSKMRDSGKDKFNNFVISTFRQVASYGTKLHNDIHKAFIKDSYDKIVDNDTLHFIELAILNNEMGCIPLTVNSIDVKIAKALMVRNLCHSGMEFDDIAIIKKHYNLGKYFSSVKIGGVNADKTIDFVKAYNKYLYEFYKRNANHNQALLSYYYQKSISDLSLETYNNTSTSGVTNFCYYTTLSDTLEQQFVDIDEFTNNVKYYIERLYELNYPENMFSSRNTKGNSHYSVRFELWDRYLMVFDLYKKYEKEGKQVKNPQLDKIGENIVNEFKIFETYSVSDLRKEIRKYYAMATKMIAQSGKGHLS